MPDVREIRDMHGRVTSKCILSDDGLYRYRLERWWDPMLPAAGFALCNPSDADVSKVDPTVRKSIGFAKRWGCGGAVWVNVCALRSPHPKALLKADDPVGPENLEALHDFADDWHHHRVNGHGGVKVIVAGWGAALPHRLGRHIETLRWALKSTELHCLGQTKAGRPRHPLMLAYDTPLEVYVGDHAQEQAG